MVIFNPSDRRYGVGTRADCIETDDKGYTHMVRKYKQEKDISIGIV